MAYITDYPKERIGGSNPYYCCSYCKMSEPQINGRINNHSLWCKYRMEKQHYTFEDIDALERELFDENLEVIDVIAQAAEAFGANDIVQAIAILSTQKNLVASKSPILASLLERHRHDVF
jgi:hypothetical protein